MRPVICVSHGFQTNYERGFCNGLAQRGCDVTLISSDRTDSAGLAPKVKAVNLRGSQEERRPRWRKAVNLLRYHAELLVYALRHRQAVLHVIGLLAPLWWCGIVQGLWFRLLCRRYVLTVHDVLPHGRHTALNRLLCALSYRLAHRLVVHTERAKQAVVQLSGVDPARVAVMEHGIEPWPSAVPAPQRRPGVEAPLLLAFGAQSHYKGTDVLLEALRDAPFAFRLVIAGRCVNGAFEAEFGRLLEGHAHRSRIDWRPRYVSEAEMEALFAEADLVVLPYRHIDQSGVLFQALRFGVPVVATRVGQFESYLTPEVGELASHCAPDAVLDALQRWHARRGEFSATRIRAIAAGFEWPAAVEALRPVYAC